MSIINAVVFGGTPKAEGISVTVHGAVYEDIILSDGQTVTTGADGTGTAVIGTGEILLTGSVSGKIFTETVTESTTDIYCMPKGSLYWYGNECTDLTGGWTNSGYTSYHGPMAAGEKLTNSLHLSITSSTKICGFGTTRVITNSAASKVIFKYHDSYNLDFKSLSTKNVDTGVVNNANWNSSEETCLNTQLYGYYVTTYAYLYNNELNRRGYIDAIWFE